MEDIYISWSEYTSHAQGVTDPAWTEVAGQIIVSIVTGILRGMKEAAVTAGKDLLQMLSVERLTAALTNYAREQTAGWISKTILDAGHSEWMTTFLHAFGLDVEDLLTAANHALDRGFVVMAENLSSTWRETSSLDREASIAMQGAISSHAKAYEKALGQWTLYSATNYAAEEEKMRMHLSAIFADDEDRISRRSSISSSVQVDAMREKTLSDMDAHIPGVIRTLGEHIRPIQNWLNEVVLTVRDSIFYLLVPGVPVNYEYVGASAASALGSAIGLGLTAHAVSVAVDLLHPIKHTGIGQLAAFVADMAGFAAIARETWYEDMKNFLGTPYMHYSRRYFRPTLPRERDLLEMATEGAIRYEDYVRAMQYWGYRDEWIPPMLEAAYRDISPFQLALILENPTMSPADIYMMLRSANISPEHSEKMADALMRKACSVQSRDVQYALLALYQAGYISDEQFDEQLEPLQLRSEAHTLLKKAARLKYVKEFTDDTISMFVDMYQKDLLDDDDFDLALSSLGLEVARKNLIVSRARVKKLAKVAQEEKAEQRKLIRAQQKLIQEIYIRAYRAGTLSEDELRSALIWAGISSEIATLTIELERQKKEIVSMREEAKSRAAQEAKMKQKYEREYVQLFRDGYIDASTLEEFLLSLGLEEDYVRALVQIEQIKKYTQKPVLD